MKALNLTQHPATAEQIEAGVFDLSDMFGGVERIRKLLTVAELPTPAQIDKIVYELAEFLDIYDTGTAGMIGGAPWLMPKLEAKITSWGHDVLYAFSKRESFEETTPDGTVVKRSVFRHEGFIRVSGETEEYREPSRQDMLDRKFGD